MMSWNARRLNRRKMKKSEKTKIKIKTIEILKSDLFRQRRILAKNLAAARSNSKLKTGYRTAAKGDLYEIHSDLFTLRAVEKQMPMPMVVKVIYGIHKLSDGTVEQCVFKDKFCPCCGNRIIGFGTPKHRVEKYCPYCGQKLWWPSC